MTRSEISTDRVPSSTHAPTIAMAPIDEFTYCIREPTTISASLVSSISNVFPNSGCAILSSTASTLLEFYKKDIDGKKLVWQMNMLADLVAKMRQTSVAFSSLKSVTNVRTLIDIVNTLPLTVGIFSEVAKLLKIFSRKS